VSILHFIFNDVFDEEIISAVHSSNVMEDFFIISMIFGNAYIVERYCDCKNENIVIFLKRMESKRRGGPVGAGDRRALEIMEY